MSFSAMRSARPLLAVDELRKLYPIGKQRIWRRSVASSFLHAVDDVSFTIGRGETVGLVGESGCGKSTIVRLIACLLDASSGSIRFEGEEIGSVPARHFGLAPQRAHIQVVFRTRLTALTRASRRFAPSPTRCSVYSAFPAPHCALESRRWRG
jgi:ABC-type oligopeptide transport system ATPase subunit